MVVPNGCLKIRHETVLKDASDENVQQSTSAKNDNRDEERTLLKSGKKVSIDYQLASCQLSIYSGHTHTCTLLNAMFYQF